MNKIYYMSYSRCSADSYCPRSRYLGSEWGGTGLQAVEGGWDLTYGNIIHKYLDKQALGQAIDFNEVRTTVLGEALKVFKEPQAKDYAALAEGTLRGFVKSVWPRILEEYEIVESEVLRHWEPQPGFVFRFKQDLLLRSKSNGALAYWDYKTTSSDSPQWISSWTKHPQMHSSMYALQKGYGIDCQHAIVQGLYKGWKDKKTNRLGSIFCKGWVNREYSMSPAYSYTYMRGKGWEPFSTFDEFDDLGSWIANMPADKLAEQFPQTGPIFPRLDISETYFRQQLIREEEVAFALRSLEMAVDHNSPDDTKLILDRSFRQEFDKCRPAYGFNCSFEPICWIPHIAADPLGSGQFTRRPQQVEDGVDDEQLA